MSIERQNGWDILRRQPVWLRIVFTLAAGAAGGALFTALKAPLAWMLGATAITTLLSMTGAPLAGSLKLRAVMASFLGVLLGSAFTPDIVHKLPQWLGVLAVLIVVMGLHGAVAFYYLHFKARFGMVDAFFSAAPGGLLEMTLQGGKVGANAHTVVLFHATRILTVVAIVPMSFRLLGGLDVPALPVTGSGPFTLSEGIWLLGCAGLGLLAGQWLRFPAPYIVGPLILSALAHGFGFSHLAPPAILVAAAQVTIGSSIGERFTGMSGRDLRSIFTHGFVSACLMLMIATLCGWMAAPLLGIPHAALILAFTPGGLAEMSLIALSMNMDPALVSAMHAFRILLVVLFATTAYRLLTRRLIGRVNGAGQPIASGKTTDS